MTTGIHLAVQLAGSNIELAQIIGSHPSFVSQLVTGHRKIPIESAKIIEQRLGVSRYDLRPDVFGEEPVKSKKVLARRSDVLRADALDWEDAV